jgi:iron(III) transport system substrate-binding protein
MSGLPFLPCSLRLPRQAAIAALALALLTGLAACRQGPGGSRPETGKPAAAPSGGPAQAVTLGVYSGRHYNTDQALYARFTQATGIRVKLLEGKDDALIERLRNEGAASPADLLVLVDAARLHRAAKAGLFQPMNAPAIRTGVPAELRDSQDRWTALTRRVRLMVVNPAQVDPALVRTYADLTRPELRGKLCLRNGRSVYNQSLVAGQLILQGEAQTKRWLGGVIANLKAPFYSSDVALARAVARGACGVGVVNSYYVARLLSGEGGAEDRALLAGVKVIVPDPAHINVSGAGITRHSRHPEAARRLLEFLVSPSGGGQGYARANHEYPLVGSGGDPVLAGFGPVRSDGVPIDQLGARNTEAVDLMRAAGWP